jgi:fused signal recognition particle receptor
LKGTVGLFDALRSGLSRTREALGHAVELAFKRSSLSKQDLEDLEAALLGADLGPALAGELAAAVRRHAGAGEDAVREALRAALLKKLSELQAADGQLLTGAPLAQPEVTLVLGVNGSGKTTTTGKLARAWAQRGDKVLLAAGDTFRAAAVEQLKLWSQRSGAGFMAQGQGADPAAVAFDAIRHAQAQGYNRVLIDTAGRLQTKHNLMEELKKVHRVAAKALEGAPHRVLLVLDGTQGQNMLSQAKLFNEAVPLTGLVVTKLDGTAKAGAVLAVLGSLKVPVQLIGVGEAPEDLQDFKREDFVRAIAG